MFHVINCPSIKKCLLNYKDLIRNQTLHKTEIVGIGWFSYLPCSDNIVVRFLYVLLM